MQLSRRSLHLRYGIAVLTTLLTVLLRFALNPVLNGNAPLLAFIMPVLLSAWYGGLGPGLVATGLSAVLGTYFFVTPSFTLAIDYLPDYVRIAMFLVEGVLISGLSETAQRAQRRTARTLLSLKQNHNLLQSVLEGTTEAVFVKDQGGRYQLVNSETARILGQPKQKIVGKTDAELLPQEIAIKLQENDRLIMQTGKTQIVEEEVLRVGERRIYLSTKDPYRDTQGNVIGVIGVAKDITWLKQAENQLRLSAQRLEALQEIDRAILRADSPQAIAQAALSRLVPIIPCDQAAVIQFNFDSQEICVLAGDFAGDRPGMTFPLTHYASLQQVTERDSLLYFAEIATLDTPPPVITKLLQLGYHSFAAIALIAEKRLIGDLLLAARLPNAFSPQDREIANEVANQLAIAIKQAQLRSQLEHYAVELEQRVVERTAQLADINQELEAFTYSVSHDLRAPLRTMQGFAQALLEDYGDHLDELGKSYIASITEDALHMDGLIADLLSYSRLSRTQITLQSVDLSDLVNEALRQLNAQIQEKHAEITVAHPLPRAIAHRSTLLQVIVNLLTNAIKFVESGVQPQIKIWAEIEETESGGDGEWGSERDGEWGSGRVGESERKYPSTPSLSTPSPLHPSTPSPSHPIAHSQMNLNRVVLWIEDNGIGIASEHQERIFRVFERLHGIESYPGTGIGLAIVRKGLERMGGQVGVNSQLGQGSRFWVALPSAVLDLELPTDEYTPPNFVS